jgi:hypothetical protein
MNRVLCWPHTSIVPGLLEALQLGRSRTVVTDKGAIRFQQALGPVEMRFSERSHQLPAGTEVYVWWKSGGFVCAPTAEVDAEERASRHMAERVLQARAQLGAAREERLARIAANIDILLPGEPAAFCGAPT